MEISIGTNVETFSKVMGPKLQQKKLWYQIETFDKVMGPKLQQKNLWDQIETFAKVIGPKVHFNLLFCWSSVMLNVPNWSLGYFSFHIGPSVFQNLAKLVPQMFSIHFSVKKKTKLIFNS